MVMRNAATRRSKTDLAALYDELEAKIRALESLGWTQDKYGEFLSPLKLGIKSNSKGSSTRGEFTSYKPAFLQAACKLAQCTHRTRLKAAFKKALEKVDSAGDFTRHSPAFE
ncbi:hypothetical protein TNCV_2356681 [Trichonephila clavipes]|nr:hypothetical protein TNCV_2356681 [Trichonephila clavipes]